MERERGSRKEKEGRERKRWRENEDGKEGGRGEVRGKRLRVCARDNKTRVYHQLR